MPLNNLVLAGAQVKGISYIGVYKALLDLNLIHTLKNVCGVSSGSLVAFLICIELDYDTCENIIYKILTYENLKTFKTSEIFNITNKYGLESGENIKKILYHLLEKQTGKRNCTFKELYEIYPSKKLIILGANITTGECEYFSVDTTPDMEVCDAIRISISVPFIFTGVTYNNMVYGDGGLINNFPVDYFNNDIDNTIACCVSFLGDYTDISSFPTYISRVFSMMCNYGQDLLYDMYSDNIINIIIPYVTIIESLTNNDYKKKIIEIGYKQFIKKIKKLPIYEEISPNFIIKKILDEVIEKIISIT